MRNHFAICHLPFAISAALVCGCSAVKPLKGGRAATIHTPSGVVQQTLAQGENPSAASRQAQEVVKVRTYTLPPGTRIEQAPVVFPARANPRRRIQALTGNPQARSTECRNRSDLAGVRQDRRLARLSPR